MRLRQRRAQAAGAATVAEAARIAEAMLVTPKEPPVEPAVAEVVVPFTKPLMAPEEALKLAVVPEVRVTTARPPPGPAMVAAVLLVLELATPPALPLTELGRPRCSWHWPARRHWPKHWQRRLQGRCRSLRPRWSRGPGWSRNRLPLRRRCAGPEAHSAAGCIGVRRRAGIGCVVAQCTARARAGCHRAGRAGRAGVVLVAARAVVLVAEATPASRTTAAVMRVFFMMLPRKVLKRTRLPANPAISQRSANAE
jgi:hypothetical protein